MTDAASAPSTPSWLSGDIVVASGNQGKVAELARLFGHLPVNLRPQSEFSVVPAEETGLTFVENAILKARAVAAQTGLPALADDSGLAVDALRGAPGVRSARYAEGRDGDDEANKSKLLQAMADTPDHARQARFHCVLVLLRHPEDPIPLIAQGRWEGVILREAQGEGGFGYDPLFYVPSHGLSAAELDAAEKNAISHRGVAAARMLALLDAG
ncbi:RdgB/HAM1 family non-canonical purine NTP pyrophosphatase [Congregibacter litoralis]|uniref:RdgB/HAM1 family non-canonical purine NTP pyrophosphatase n=1 Tax=Congregibacter litoralis TaxID=393662 RepID=UPI00006B18E1|nr:RdgB/HAM1 family non-canonical purine NTP pyrophosphatase [Congregibacter litoralis]